MNVFLFHWITIAHLIITAAKGLDYNLLKKSHTEWHNIYIFLAHLSQTHCPASVLRPSSVRPSSIHKLRHLLLRNRLADQSQILCGASLGRGNEILFRHVGHMTKMAATPIYGKNPSKIFFSRTGRPIFMELGMLHWGLQPIIV